MYHQSNTGLSSSADHQLSTKSAEIVQLKQNLAAMPLADQQQAVRPHPPIQYKGQGSGVHEVAAAGFQGASTHLPHLDRIQSSFGQHDVSNVQTFVGGKAAESSSALGALAYASGSNIAFKDSPDLHTAAHEAAHVVQQRAGVQLKDGVGQTGDVYERNADAVADRVVQGKPALDLLGEGRTSSSHSVQYQDEKGLEDAEILLVSPDQDKTKLRINRGTDHGVQKGIELSLMVDTTERPATVVSARERMCEAETDGYLDNDVAAIRVFTWGSKTSKKMNQPTLRGGRLLEYPSGHSAHINRGKQDGVLAGQSGILEYHDPKRSDIVLTCTFVVMKVEKHFSVAELDVDLSNDPFGLGRFRRARVIHWGEVVENATPIVVDTTDPGSTGDVSSTGADSTGAQGNDDHTDDSVSNQTETNQQPDESGDDSNQKVSEETGDDTKEEEQTEEKENEYTQYYQDQTDLLAAIDSNNEESFIETQSTIKEHIKADKRKPQEERVYARFWSDMAKILAGGGPDSLKAVQKRRLGILARWEMKGGGTVWNDLHVEIGLLLEDKSWHMTHDENPM